jgi:hypothetical protein
MPDADSARDWLHRSIAEAPIDPERPGLLEGLILDVKRLVGPPSDEWPQSLSPRRRPSRSGR